jgi:hypothetical protein
VTRRNWSDRHAAKFIKAFQLGQQLIRAFDKDQRGGGRQIGWLKLLEEPYKERLSEMPEADLQAEGFPELSKVEFIDRFFDGNDQLSVWVLRFEFHRTGTRSACSVRLSAHAEVSATRSETSSHPLEPKTDEKVLGDTSEEARSALLRLNSATLLHSDESSTSIYSSPEAAKVEVLEPLTPEEESERHRLELKVERAFYEAGVALRELRDRRLYRSTHKTWERYCKDRFGYGRDSADLKILAIGVVDNLKENLPTNGRQILPTNERQVRPLTTLELEEQCQVWSEAVEESGGKVPSGRVVKGIVERIKERHTTPSAIPYQVGDVFLVCAQSGEFRKYNGCWAIARAVNNFTVEVEVYDALVTMKPDNLELINSPQECRQVQSLGERIQRLRQCELDRTAYPILAILGRYTYLTPLEEGLLGYLEQWYLGFNPYLAHPSRDEGNERQSQQQVLLSQIRRDGGTQPRAKLDLSHVATLVEVLYQIRLPKSTYNQETSIWSQGCQRKHI